MFPPFILVPFYSSSVFFSRSLLVRGLCPRLPASVAVCPGQAQGPAYYSAGARDTVQVTSSVQKLLTFSVVWHKYGHSWSGIKLILFCDYSSVGETIHVICEAESVPAAKTFSWTFNGSPLSPSGAKKHSIIETQHGTSVRNRSIPLHLLPLLTNIPKNAPIPRPFIAIPSTLKTACIYS